MDIRLTVNGKEVSLSEEQIKLLGLEPEKKKTGYDLKKPKESLLLYLVTQGLA